MWKRVINTFAGVGYASRLDNKCCLLTVHVRLCRHHLVASLQRSPLQKSPSHCLCCRLRLGQLGRRCLQLLPNYGLLCQISSREVHRSQIRLGWCGDSRPGGHHTAVPHPGLQCHAHEYTGCHCHCWSAASSGLWARHFALLGGLADLMLELIPTLIDFIPTHLGYEKGWCMLAHSLWPA